MYDDDRDALAAEYVLGTLSADERDQVEALLVIDPGFAEIVRVWERRLGELNVMVEAVEPPPDVWDRIKTEIDGAERRIAAEAEAMAQPAEDTPLPLIEEAAPQTAPEAAAEAMPEAEPKLEPSAEVTPPEAAPEQPTETVPDLLAEPRIDAAAPPTEDSEEQDLEDTSAVAALASSLLSPESPQDAAPPPQTPAAPRTDRSAEIVDFARQTRRWRGLTVAMSAIAAVLAVYIAVGQLAPGLLPAGRISRSAPVAAPPGSRLVAVLQQEPTAPAFLLTIDPQHRIMTVRTMTATADAGRSYELWLIGKDSKPRSLGLVGAQEFTTRPLPTDFDTAAMSNARYAVSLEPAGGAPNGVPTGPILFTGKMVESVPAAPPPKT
ncbi:MAG TPA: anti-sigma factor [Xanthobacteraceae bacterium]|nr:anti-sigma factor [Xanthobacteraceae bacterium]